MPSSISYDPSLVLGNTIDSDVVGLIGQIDAVQFKTDAAQEKMNSYIMMKRSLAMTVNELAEMGIDNTPLTAKMQELDGFISQSAQDYLDMRLEAETQIQQLKQQMGESRKNSAAASPVDFSQSKILTLPLAAESIKIDAQYFTFGSNEENDTLANIEKYVKESTAVLGSKSNDVASAVSSQLSSQKQNHSLAGTLIITATATHRNVCLFDPLVLHTDNAVDSWNYTYPDSRITPADIEAPKPGSDNTSQQVLSLLSGAVYGSSFVGMVHILKTDSTANNIDNETMNQLRGKLQLGGWLQNSEGGIGVDSDTLNDVKKLLSSQKVATHISMVAMGTTPSIASGEIKLGLTKIIQSDTNKNLALINSINQLSGGEIETISTDANKAKTAARLVKLQQASTTAVMRELAEIDHGTNKMLDINSLMAAFENYIETIRSAESTAGVPIRYYIKNITREQVIDKIAQQYGSLQNNNTAAKE